MPFSWLLLDWPYFRDWHDYVHKLIFKAENYIIILEEMMLLHRIAIYAVKGMLGTMCTIMGETNHKELICVGNKIPKEYISMRLDRKFLERTQKRVGF